MLYLYALETHPHLHEDSRPIARGICTERDMGMTNSRLGCRNHANLSQLGSA